MHRISDQQIQILENNAYKHIRKRITKELQKIHVEDVNLQYISSSDVSDNDFQNNNEIFFTFIDKKYLSRNVYKFVITPNYPFTKPKFYIDDIDYYKHFLYIKNIDTQNLLKQISGLHCLCCSSITCSNNWSPRYTMYDIITEIRTYRTYRRNVLNKIFADKIKSKYLIKDINIYSWLL